MFKKLALVVLSFGAAAGAQAMALRPHTDFESRSPSTNSTPAAAPEIDPASAMSAFTLLAGGLVLIRGRRSSK